MKHVVLAGASTYGVKNLGDDAMFRNLVDGFRRRAPECRLTFLARHPDPAFDEYFGVRSIKNIEYDTRAESVGRWFRGFNPGEPTAHLTAIREAIADCDLLVIGGNAFMEISDASYMRGVPSYAATLATWARLFGKPYALYGVAAHPLKHDLTRELARFLCNNAVAVTVREEFTRQQLLEAGVDGGNITVLADPAFGLEPVVGSATASDVLAREGIALAAGKPVVAIAFRHMYWKWDQESFGGFSRVMAAAADFAVEQFDADVLFIPNCTYDVDGTSNQDDRPIAAGVCGLMRHADRAHSIRGEHWLHEILSLYGRSDLLVSNRRHSCVFSAIHGVPFVALSSDHDWHFRPFIEALGVPDQLVALGKDSVPRLTSKMAESWKRRDALSGALRSAIPGLKAEARRHVPVICDAAGL